MEHYSHKVGLASIILFNTTTASDIGDQTLLAAFHAVGATLVSALQSHKISKENEN